MAKLDPPRLSRGGLTGRIFVTTHGKILGHDAEGRELIESSVKYDVTNQFEALVGFQYRTLVRRPPGIYEAGEWQAPLDAWREMRDMELPEGCEVSMERRRDPGPIEKVEVPL